MKILFAAIILSFCLFGIGDIIRNYAASKCVLRVGDVRVTADMFLRVLDQEKQKIKNNNGQKPLSDEEMEKIDVNGIVLDKLIKNSVLNETIKKFNIRIPKKSIVAIVESIPEFRKNGVFDQRIYEDILKRSGISEKDFIRQIQENLALTQLLHPVVVGYRVPNVIKEIMAREYASQKTILVQKVSKSANPKIAADKNSKKDEPSRNEIMEYYHANIAKYRTPELRNVAILIVDYDKLLDDVVVAQEDIEKYFVNNKSAFAGDERKDFKILLFDEKESANQAWNMVNNNVEIEEIRKKFAANVQVVSGKRADFPVEIRNELFNLAKGKASAVYNVGEKYCLYVNTKTVLVDKKTDEQIKREIKTILQNEKIGQAGFYEKVKELKNKIDDGFGAGKEIDEIAKETGMKVVELKSLQKGKISDRLASFIGDQETLDEVEKSIFSVEEKQASEIIGGNEAGAISYVVFVRDVVPAGAKDEIDTKKIQKDMEIEKNDKRIAQQVENIVNKGPDAGKEMQKLGKVQKFTISKKDILFSWNVPNKKVENMLKTVQNIDFAFNALSTLKKNEISFLKLDNGDYVLIFLQSVFDPVVTSDGGFEMVSRLVDSNSANDAESVALLAFKKQLTIKVHDKEIKKLMKRLMAYDSESVDF